MFQFRRFPTYTYLIQCTLTGYCPAGLPHSEIHGSMDICSSPWLIAACHVLRRLLMPRHSPCALISLTNHSQDNSCSLIVNYAGFTDSFEIVIVTLIFSDVVPQLKLKRFPCSFKHRNLSVALLHFVKSHCSVFKVLFQLLLKSDLKVQFLRL